MIPEKMLELLVINFILEDPYCNNYNRDKLVDRWDELVNEFLKPYVITEKSE